MHKHTVFLFLVLLFCTGCADDYYEHQRNLANQAFKEGAYAAESGVEPNANPYVGVQHYTYLSRSWLNGYLSVKNKKVKYD